MHRIVGMTGGDRPVHDQMAELVDAYSNYIKMVELNYLNIPLAGSSPAQVTKKIYGISRKN